MDLIISKRHPSLTSSHDVFEICRPFFDKFGLSYFNYSRVYYDLKHISLTSDAKWIDFFYKEDYKNRLLFSPNMAKYLGSHTLFLWSEFANHKLIKNARDFNIDHGITIVEHGDNYIEYFSFAGKRDNYNIIPFYFSHADIIEIFIQYFISVSSNLIKNCEKSKIVLPNNIDDDVIYTGYSEDNLGSKKVEFLNQIPIKKFRVNTNYGSKLETFYITRREAECLNLLAAGKSAKEMAKLLGIAPRTVEQHIYNLKLKARCNKVSELLTIYIRSTAYNTLKNI